MDIAAVRLALAAAADTIAGLNCYSYHPNDIVEPAFIVWDVEIDFDQAMHRGMDEARFTCAVLVATSDDKAGQANLDAYLAGSGSSSIKAALEAARGAPGQSALSGAADDLHVVRVTGYRPQQIGDRKYYSAEFMVRVIGSGA